MTFSFETAQNSNQKPDLENSSSVKHELEYRFGFQPQEIEALGHQAEVMQPHTRVVVRTPLSALEGVIREGRLQAASETKTSNGLTAGSGRDLHRLDEYLAMRQQFESEKLHWNESDPHIIYGFLGYSADLEDSNIQAPTYGRIELQLRNDTIERSSFTIGDSLANTFAGSPVEFLDHNDATLAQQAIEFSRQQEIHALNQVPYIEAQVHGGVSTQDIESVIITIKPNNLDQQLVSNLQELHAQAPDCKIIFNLDYTSAQKLPIDIIHTLSFAEFRPVVIGRGDPVFIQRNGASYRNDNGLQTERHYSEDKERLSILGRKFMTFFNEHEKPENLGKPSLGHFRNGDRFSPRD